MDEKITHPTVGNPLHVGPCLSPGPACGRQKRKNAPSAPGSEATPAEYDIRVRRAKKLFVKEFNDRIGFKEGQMITASIVQFIAREGPRAAPASQEDEGETPKEILGDSDFMSEAGFEVQAVFKRLSTWDSMKRMVETKIREHQTAGSSRKRKRDEPGADGGADSEAVRRLLLSTYVRVLCKAKGSLERCREIVWHMNQDDVLNESIVTFQILSDDDDDEGSSWCDANYMGLSFWDRDWGLRIHSDLNPRQAEAKAADRGHDDVYVIFRELRENVAQYFLRKGFIKPLTAVLQCAPRFHKVGWFTDFFWTKKFTHDTSPRPELAWSGPLIIICGDRG